MYLESLALVPLLGPELVEGRRGDEDDEGHQIGILEDLQRLRVQVEDAELAGVDHGADGVHRRSVVGLLVLAVLHELAVDDVRLELRPRDEVVVLTVDLAILLRPTRVYIHHQ